jgi:hypothetical protein
VLGIKDPKSAKSFENYQKTLHQTWSRAAELPSPAPRGHFLREFGQSDREIIENANDEASVPQALTMMNGSLLSQLTSAWSTAQHQPAQGRDQRGEDRCALPQPLLPPAFGQGEGPYAADPRILRLQQPSGRTSSSPPSAPSASSSSSSSDQLETLNLKLETI